MKKLLGVLLAILVIYVIYFDLTVGTLPSATTTQKTMNIKTSSVTKPQTKIPFFEEKVKPGETVMSIVEHQLGKPLPVSINDLIVDFQALNPGESPEKIKIGATYHFPDYSE